MVCFEETFFYEAQSITTLSMNLRDTDMLLEPLQKTFLKLRPTFIACISILSFQLPANDEWFFMVPLVGFPKVLCYLCGTRKEINYSY